MGISHQHERTMTPSLSLRRHVLAGTQAQVALQVVAAQVRQKESGDGARVRSPHRPKKKLSTLTSRPSIILSHAHRPVSLSFSPKSSRKTECDARCQTQVKLLEGALLFTILAITVGSGVWLLGSVDTPTRFGGAAQD